MSKVNIFKKTHYTSIYPDIKIKIIDYIIIS